jgi:lysozyme family protein
MSLLTSRFLTAFAILLGHEGGEVNNPKDPGGATKFGLSLRFVRSKGRLFDLDRDGDVDADDIHLISVADAQGTYFTDFWQSCRCDDLPPTLALLVFDAAVNNGEGTARIWLQRALGLKPDGVFGPATMAAVAARPNVAEAFHMTRVETMTTLSGWDEFGRGWCKRLSRLVFQSQRMV